MNTIAMAIFTAILLPAIAPVCLDALACVRVWIMNKAKGRPTWKVGTQFPQIFFPSGNELYNAVIASVSFRYVTLRTKFGYVDIKKRDMLKLVLTYMKD